MKAYKFNTAKWQCLSTRWGMCTPGWESLFLSIALWRLHLIEFIKCLLIFTLVFNDYVVLSLQVLMHSCWAAVSCSVYCSSQFSYSVLFSICMTFKTTYWINRHVHVPFNAAWLTTAGHLYGLIDKETNLNGSAVT